VTTVAVSVTPGAAALNGQVLDDAGAPVGGATVHLERLVGTQLAVADVVALADGTFTAPGIIGGLYRVRAWRAPDLAIVDPQIFFLGSTETRTVNLQMQRFTGLQISSNIAPNPPIAGEPANLVVLVAASTVAADGTVHGQGKPGVEVVLTGDGAWSVAGSATATTGPTGTASWQLTCEALGQQSLSVIVGATNSFPLGLPACAPVPSTTTSTSAVATITTTTTIKRRTG
ncbi:MAG: carboxypeptidase-like regulatory domain-containing protein, partial [Acidimicrobiales bacterium]